MDMKSEQQKTFTFSIKYYKNRFLNFYFGNVFRFTEDIYQMTGYRPGLYWQWTWRYIGPVIMACILVSSIVCLAIDKPTYSAYKKEEVKLSFNNAKNPRTSS